MHTRCALFLSELVEVKMQLRKYLPSRPFMLMFSIILLLNINFAMLRSVRNTLAVVDLGGGAQSIPFFELFGAMPGAFLMTALIARLLNRFSIGRVFVITLALFVSFFVFFAQGLYPLLVQWKLAASTLPWVCPACSMLFYTMAELWKPVLIGILFWGLINQHTEISRAKTLYAPLMLGGSLGGMIAGPLIAFATSESSWHTFALASDQWAHSLNMVIGLIALFSALTALLWRSLARHYAAHSTPPPLVQSPKRSLSIKEGLLLCKSHPALRLLAWTVIADYIAYSLGEVLFLDMLKHKYPAACDYCHYLGQLSLWSGILTVIFALVIAPWLLKNRRWVVAALVTPIALLLIEGAFFSFVRARGVGEYWFHWSEEQWVGIIVFLGSLQYCVGRATKYTLLDSSKEVALVAMADHEKMQGKLVVDGLSARIGRGGASLLSLSLIEFCGGVLASAWLAGIVAIGVIVSWIMGTQSLGRWMAKAEPLSKKQEYESEKAT